MTRNLPHVTRRLPATDPAQRIADTIVARGTDTATVANAAGLPVSDLEDRLRTGDFTMSEIVRVGGVLSMEPSDLYGAPA
jgi:hypothetical protein